MTMMTANNYDHMQIELLLHLFLSSPSLWEKHFERMKYSEDREGTFDSE